MRFLVNFQLKISRTPFFVLLLCVHCMKQVITCHVCTVLDLVDNFDCYYCIRSLNNFQYLNRFTFLFVRPTVVVLFGFPNIMLIILFIPNVVELIFVIISFAKKYPWSGSAVRQGAGPPVPTSTI